MEKAINKICTKCKLIKPLSDFNKSKKHKLGVVSHCKLCVKEYKKIYRLNNLEKINLGKKVYFKNNKDKINEYKKNYRLKNREKISERDRKYRELRKEITKNYSRGYRKKNKEILKIKRNNYMKEKRNRDNLFRLRQNILCLIRNTITNNNYKKLEKTNLILGCTYIQFKEYLEQQFKGQYNKNFNWDNFHLYNLDHKIPISYAKTKKEIINLNHHTNFQLLKKEKNLLKNNKWKDLDLLNFNLLKKKNLNSKEICNI